MNTPYSIHRNPTLSRISTPFLGFKFSTRKTSQGSMEKMTQYSTKTGKEQWVPNTLMYHKVKHTEACFCGPYLQYHYFTYKETELHSDFLASLYFKSKTSFLNKSKTQGDGNCLTVKSMLLFQRTQSSTSIPLSSRSQLPLTPAPRNPTPPDS